MEGIIIISHTNSPSHVEQKVRRMIRKGYHPDDILVQKNKFDNGKYDNLILYTSLTYAIFNVHSYMNSDFIEFLINMGADVNIKFGENSDRTFMELLTKTIINSCINSRMNVFHDCQCVLSIIKPLISAGIDINQFKIKNLKYITSIKHLKYMIDTGLDVINYRDRNNRTLLFDFIYIYPSNFEMFDVLLKHGLDINHVDGDGDNLATYIIRYSLMFGLNKDKWLLYLIGRGINLHVKGNLIIIYAVQKCCFSVVKILLKHGFKLTSCHINGTNALDIARESKFKSIINSIQEYYAKILQRAYRLKYQN